MPSFSQTSSKTSVRKCIVNGFDRRVEVVYWTGVRIETHEDVNRYVVAVSEAVGVSPVAVCRHDNAHDGAGLGKPLANRRLDERATVLLGRLREMVLRDTRKVEVRLLRAPGVLDKFGQAGHLAGEVDTESVS